MEQFVMLWASIDVDIVDDPTFLELSEADPRNMLRFLRLVQIAKKALADGNILLPDGRPATNKTLARAHRETERKWIKFMEVCQNLNLIFWNSEEICWKISDWRRWHKKPSESAEAIRERVRRHRSKKRSQSESIEAEQKNAECNTSETPENTCNTSTTTTTTTTTTTDPSIPPDPHGGEDGRTDSVRFSKGDQAAPADAMAAYSRCAKAVLPGPIKARDSELFEGLLGAQREGGYSAADLTGALEYAVEATQWAMHHGPKKVVLPRDYMAEAATRILPKVSDRNIDRHASARDNFDDPGPVVFRPPEKARDRGGGP